SLQVLDWLLTLEMEVSFIWQAPWTIMKGLYLFEQYMPFIGVPLIVFFIFTDVLSGDTCTILYQCIACKATILLFVLTMIFYIFNQGCFHPHRGLGLVIFYILTWIVILVSIGLYLQTINFQAPAVPHLLGCTKKSQRTMFSAAFAAGAVYNAVMLLLMIIRAISAFKSGVDSNLMRVIYCDGIIYYIYMFGMLSTILIVVIL
ncbi:hypothetical protein P691DRAFT_640775, partial [Macrolepiota fuliginosa MF-IS2]